MYTSAASARRRAKVGLISFKNDTIRQKYLSPAANGPKEPLKNPIGQKKQQKRTRGSRGPSLLSVTKAPQHENRNLTVLESPKKSKFSAKSYLDANADLKWLGVSESAVEEHAHGFGDQERRPHVSVQPADKRKENENRIALMDSLSTPESLGRLNLHCIVVLQGVCEPLPVGLLDALHRSVRFLSICAIPTKSDTEEKRDEELQQQKAEKTLRGMFRSSAFRNDVLFTASVEHAESRRTSHAFCNTVVLLYQQIDRSDKTDVTPFQCAITMSRFLSPQTRSVRIGRNIVVHPLRGSESIVSFQTKTSTQSIEFGIAAPALKHIKPIALYFPQFHPIPENSKFWGAAFTEWTLLEPCTALPGAAELRKPHADIGWYNGLGLEHRSKQGEMCKKYGLYGLCFYHYWFGNRKVMHRPAEQMLLDGQPDVPFFFSWANESWTKRWDGSDQEMLLEQRYGDEPMWRKHFQYLLAFFKHPRYVKIGNKPVFCFYRLGDIPFNVASSMLSVWQSLAKDSGFDGLYVVATLNQWIPARAYDALLDACFEFQPGLISSTMRVETLEPDVISRVTTYSGNVDQKKCFDTLKMHALADRRPALQMQDVVQYSGTYVSFNNTPRQRNHIKNITLHDEPNAQVFYCGLLRAMSRALCASPEGTEDVFVFINAFNEWNESAVLEPSRQDGYGMLEAIEEALLFFGQRADEVTIPQDRAAILSSRKQLKAVPPVAHEKAKEESTWYETHWKSHSRVSTWFKQHRDLFLKHCSQHILRLVVDAAESRSTPVLFADTKKATLPAAERIAICCQLHQISDQSIIDDVFRWVESLYLAVTSAGGTTDIFFTVLHGADRKTLRRTIAVCNCVWASSVRKIDVWSSNRGMDVGAFLWQLYQMKSVDGAKDPAVDKKGWRALSQYDFVAKMHSKSDSNWRKTLGDPLFGSVKNARMVLELMQKQSSVGMCGSAALCLGDCEGQNGPKLRALEKKCFNRVATALDRQFVGGTIFVQRASLIDEMISRVGLAYIKEAFEGDAQGRFTDTKQGGTYAHTFERFFGYYTRMKSLHIAPILL